MYQSKDEIYRNGARLIHVIKQKRLSKKSGISIYESALSRLEHDGFNIEQKGSRYIAQLIEALYFERELLKKYYKRPSYEGYWNLNDINNPHYSELGDPKEILNEIRKSIIASCYEDDDADIQDLIYEFADMEIAHREYYRNDEEG